MFFQKWTSFSALFIALAFLAACTDYVQQIDDRYGEWDSSLASDTLSSSFEKSSSSVKGMSSSSGEKSSSSESPVSSSSDGVASPCKTEFEDNCEYGELVDNRDGQTYKTVRIGDQIWMAENLNFETDSSSCYNNEESNCTKYGRLYRWEAAVSACPNGWHLPSLEEWYTLFASVGGGSMLFKVLTSTSGWGWNNSGGTDDYGFTVLPAGGWGDGGHFFNEGDFASFWTSTEWDSDLAEHVYFDNDAHSYFTYKEFRSSVRCLQGDAPEQTAESSSSGSPVSSSSDVMVDGTMTDSRNGQTYKTVTIGSQTWMAENLNFETDSSFCYKNDESFCAKYGRLYIWATAVGKPQSECGYSHTCALPSGNIQGICPNGWHLPSVDEWETLFNAVGGRSTAGKVLRSSSSWIESGDGTDAFGFSAFPAGYRTYDGFYTHDGNGAYFWSSTEVDSGHAVIMLLNYYDDDAYTGSYDKTLWYSVRCLKN